MRQELRRAPSPVAAEAKELLDVLPAPASTRSIRFFDFEFPYPDVTPDWHTDPKSGITVAKDRWPDIDYRKADEIGSAKNIWELNRHQFLETWASENTEDSALAIVRVILDWIANNQRPFGINWSSSLEPAFRLMSWQRALEKLGEYEVIDKARPIIEKSVREQSDHILRFPSLFSSANNHRMGELAGVLAGACISKSSDSRAILADFKKEVAWQVTRDGVDREQALFYHDYVLGFIQRVRHYSQLLGMDESAFFDPAIARMSEFSQWMRYAENEWFETGDRDDGTPMNEITYKKQNGIRYWQEGGYAIWHEGDVSMCFRAGNFGYPSIAAHAHCDQLSVQLALNGLEVLTDSGTFCYHEDEDMRRYFKGTSAHNTIRVDGLDQAEYGGPFLWSTHADGELLQIQDDIFEGLHFGYNRLGDGTTHGRRLILNRGALLKIDDLVTTSGKHQYELFWNLGPGCSVSSFGENRVDVEVGGRTVRLTFESSLPIEVSKAEGWFSRKFGEKQKIDRIDVRAAGSTWSITTLVEVLS